MGNESITRATLVLLLATAACGGDATETGGPAAGDNAAGAETPRASTPDDSTHPATEAPPVAASPCTAPGSAPAAAPSPFDPATLHGYVSGRRAPEGEGRGRVETIRLTPNATVPSVFELACCVAVDGEARELLAIVPSGFPVPFDEGDEISYEGGASGGGPNYRATMIVRDANGALLLAIGRAPAEITVGQGRRVRSEPGSRYREDVHAVVFTPTGGSPLRVDPGGWARLSTPDGDFLVWGTAHQRTLIGSSPPPPDYVGSWLDFAITRLR